MWVFANIFGSNAWFYSEILAHFFSSFFAGICLPHMPATSVPAAPWALVTFSATMYPTRVLSNLRPLYLALALVGSNAWFYSEILAHFFFFIFCRDACHTCLPHLCLPPLGLLSRFPQQCTH